MCSNEASRSHRYRQPADEPRMSAFHPKQTFRCPTGALLCHVAAMRLHGSRAPGQSEVEDSPSTNFVDFGNFVHLGGTQQ